MTLELSMKDRYNGRQIAAWKTAERNSRLRLMERYLLENKHLGCCLHLKDRDRRDNILEMGTDITEKGRLSRKKKYSISFKG